MHPEEVGKYRLCRDADVDDLNGRVMGYLGGLETRARAQSYFSRTERQ
jgi:hypothetical protein